MSTVFIQQSVASYRVSTNTNSSSSKVTQVKTNKSKETRSGDQLRLFIFKPEFPETSVDTPTAFALAGEATEQGTFRVWKRMPTVSRTEGQHSRPIKILIKTKHQSDDSLFEVSANLIFPLNYHSDISHIEKIYCCKRLQILFLYALKLIGISNCNKSSKQQKHTPV
jgi:hypothetical protein